MKCGEHYFDEMNNVVGGKNMEFTEKDMKRINKLLKRLTRKINTITYSYGDITITIIKENKEKQ